MQQVYIGLEKWILQIAVVFQTESSVNNHNTKKIQYNNTIVYK